MYLQKHKSGDIYLHMEGKIFLYAPEEEGSSSYDSCLILEDEEINSVPLLREKLGGELIYPNENNKEVGYFLFDLPEELK